MLHKIFISVTLLSCFAFIVPQQNSAEEEEIEWISFQEMMIANEQQPKKVIIDVYTDWCGWCKKMDAFTYENKGVAAYINENFYPVKFNAESKELIELYGQQYNYSVPSRGRGYHELAMIFTRGQLTYPTTVFLDDNMTSLKTFPGYRNPVDMDKMLHFINDEHYVRLSYDDFAKSFVSKLQY